MAALLFFNDDYEYNARPQMLDHIYKRDIIITMFIQVIM